MRSKRISRIRLTALFAILLVPAALADSLSRSHASLPVSLPVPAGTGTPVYSVESGGAGPLQHVGGEATRHDPALSVPLPAAGWLLLSALSGLGLIARRRAGRTRR
jgi:hypothetical protein